MTNREALEANKSRVAELFRDAIRAKILQWDADNAIEGIVGEIDGLNDAAEHFAVPCDNGSDVSEFSDDELVEALLPLLQNPHGTNEPEED